MFAAGLLLSAAATIYVLTLPGVGDAEARVEAILAEHRGRASSLPPPAYLGAAIVSTEDENFYDNAFFNVAAGAGRAALATLGTSEDPGGSTISQQLAKTLYPHSGGIGGNARRDRSRGEALARLLTRTGAEHVPQLDLLRQRLLG